MRGATRFKSAQVPRQPGEIARLRVLQGPDFGATYIVVSTRVRIGRGEENDVLISDLKASRSHAELYSAGDGWEVKDSGSANGILINGEKRPSARIHTRDTFSMGETTFEFIQSTSESTQALSAPIRPLGGTSLTDGVRLLAQAEQNQSQRVSEIRNLQPASLSEIAEVFRPTGAVDASGGGGLLNGPKGIVLILVLGGLLLLDNGEEQKPKLIVRKSAEEKKAEKAAEASRDLASYLPGADSELSGGGAEATFFKAGFREFTLGNYVRARSQFENVLQVNPSHGGAKQYLEACRSKIEKDVKSYLRFGKRELEAGKLKNAQGQFESVMRILSRDQSNADYLEAKDALSRVKSLIKKNGGSG